MRKITLALAASVSILSSSAAFAGPPCNIHVGGLCGSDYDGWMELWRRTNRGHVINPVSPGGYGLLPNGQRFYPNGNGGFVNGSGFVYGGGGFRQGYGRGGGSYTVTVPGQVVTVTRPVQIGVGYHCTIRDGSGLIIQSYDGPCSH